MDGTNAFFFFFKYFCWVDSYKKNSVPLSMQNILYIINDYSMRHLNCHWATYKFKY